MINGNNILHLTPLPLSHLRVHQDASAECILTSMILSLTPPPLSYSRRAKNRDHPSPLANIDPLLRRFVRPHNMRHPRRVQKVLNRFVSIADRPGASLSLPEPRVVQMLLLLVLRRVRPQQVVRELLDLLRPLVDGHHLHRERTGDLVDALQRALCLGEGTGDASVHAEDHVVDRRREGQAVEHRVRFLPEVLPDVRAVARLQLAQEAASTEVGLPAVYRAELVITAKHEDLVGEHDFLSEEVGENLDGVLTTVDVVAQEEKTARGEMHA